MMEKNEITDLAILGGPPLFENPVHTNKPNMGDASVFSAYLEQAMRSRQFTNHGPIVTELERKLQEHLNVEHCVLASSGTAAMDLVIKALNLTGEVIIPSFTFVSTPHTLAWAGLRPVFGDIEADGWNLSSQHAKRLINTSTSAIIATHCWGEACDIEGLEAICTQANIPLIFDAAHAFDCRYKNQKLGSMGTAEVFSFHATKLFHTVEGGAITTSDKKLAEKLRKMRNFGFSAFDYTDCIGTNAKMSEVHAAMGLANLAAIETTLEKCKEVHQTYATHLANVSGISLHKVKASRKTNHHYVIALMDPLIFGMSRDELSQVLHKENILARRYYYPGCHKLEPYVSQLANEGVPLPHTDTRSSNILALPAGAAIDLEDVLKISTLLGYISKNANKISCAI